MQTEDRLHALDAVRAFALLSGIVLHATMTFMPGLASVGYPADVSQSTTLQTVFYVIHVFRMTLFFMIAGFFARIMFHRKGIMGFLRDRAKRILIPFIVGWVIFGPLTLALIGIALHPSISAPTQSSTSTSAVTAAFPLVHLWFLYSLLMFYAGTVLVREYVVRFVDRTHAARTRIDALIKKLVTSNAAPFVLAAPAALCLYVTPNLVMWSGVATPDRGFAPQLPATIAFGTAFAFGWLLQRQSDLLQVWKRRWIAHLVLAIAFTIASLRIAELATNSQTDDVAIKATFAVFYTFATWHWIFGIIGVALRYFSNESPARRYIADASYWMYLAHLPLVFALQLMVLNWHIHWSIKFPLIVGVTVVILLLSYRYGVRYSFIGEALNGRRQKRQEIFRSTARSDVMALSPQAMVSPQAVIAELKGVHKHFGATKALDGIDLQIRSGEVLAILGPNGAGKSTAIALLLGLQEADAGSVRLFGDMPEQLAARKNVGVMLQEVALSPELRVREHIDLTSRYYDASYSVDDVLRMTNTTDLAARFYGKLSGGQKRLAQFALAICGRPKLLFLDEPTVGLDVEAREALWATVRRLVGEGCSVVLTTHYLEEAEALADRVAVLAKGQLVAMGSVDEVRALVARKRISCITALNIEQIRHWPNVTDVAIEYGKVHITVIEAESVTRRLLSGDATVRELEISSAGLAEAFAQLTQTPLAQTQLTHEAA